MNIPNQYKLTVDFRNDYAFPVITPRVVCDLHPFQGTGVPLTYEAHVFQERFVESVAEVAGKVERYLYNRQWTEEYILQ